MLHASPDAVYIGHPNEIWEISNYFEKLEKQLTIAISIWIRHQASSSRSNTQLRSRRLRAGSPQLTTENLFRIQGSHSLSCMGSLRYSEEPLSRPTDEPRRIVVSIPESANTHLDNFFWRSRALSRLPCCESKDDACCLAPE